MTKFPVSAAAGLLALTFLSACAPKATDQEVEQRRDSILAEWKKVSIDGNGLVFWGKDGKADVYDRALAADDIVVCTYKDVKDCSEQKPAALKPTGPKIIYQYDTVMDTLCRSNNFTAVLGVHAKSNCTDHASKTVEDPVLSKDIQAIRAARLAR